MKSQAVFVLTGGMPGVSGLLKVRAPRLPGRMAGALAKLPGVVPCFWVEGLPPTGGRWWERSVSVAGESERIMAAPSAVGLG